MKLPGPASGRFVHNARGKASTCQTSKIITLLTDFGLKDPYVGIMKGVIHAITGNQACPPKRQRRLVAPFTDNAVPASWYPAVPSANPFLSLSDHDVITIVDITHDIEPQDIREAAFLIEEYYRFFPANTVHVAIVDPTVGSARRSIILSKERYLFVGPDNGIFTLIMGDDPEVYLIEDSGFMLKDISSTFHGRDVFAPAAAYLSKGIQPSAFGKQITDPIGLQNVLPRIKGNSLKGEVVRFDRFGNAITNIKVDYLTNFLHGRPFEVRIAGIAFSAISRSYYEDTFTCLVGSSGYLEFGFFKGSFAETTQIAKNEQVTVEC